MSDVKEQTNSVSGIRKENYTVPNAILPSNLPKVESFIPDTPNERLQNLLQEATALCVESETYLKQCTSKPSKETDALENKTRSSDWVKLSENGETMFEFSERWTTDVVEAKMLGMFAYMLKAKRVLEVGMFTGYGTLTIAESLPDDGRITALEIDPFLKKFSEPIFQSSPHGHKINVQIGDALKAIQEWPVDDKIDMVFIDADKGSYAAYYETVISRGLLAPGGVIVVDNTLFKGTPYIGKGKYDNHGWNDGGVAIANFNEYVANDNRVEQIMLPVRDGVTIVRLKETLKECMSDTVVVEKSEIMASKSKEEAVTIQNDATTPDILSKMKLDGKNALVTGGGQGIGRAFAHALAEAGASVCIVDIAQERAEAVAQEIRAKGSRSFALKVDCTKQDEIKQMISTVAERWGQLHIAVNNAGINRNSAAEDTPIEDWDLTFNLNTRGVFLCCQEEARHMLKHGYGKIINTASMATLLVPHPQKQAAYNCSKAAVVKMTQTLACEWADKGLNVNCISPGIVDTPLIWENPELNKLAETWLEQIPAKRLATTDDLQSAIVYLASDTSSYMIGHNMVIEGGQSLW